MDIISTFSLFPILIFASIWDMKFKKIPNALILFGLVAGLMVTTYYEGFSGLFHATLSICLTWLVFIFLWGVWAAGDIKLMLVIASFVGALSAIKIGFLSLLLGAIVFILLNPKHFFVSGQRMLYFLFYKMPIQPVGRDKSIAFSPYILMSAIIVLVIGKQIL